MPRLPRHRPGPDANTLELFARIAAAGSFAQAARELGQTRAAVSRRVAALEARLGTPLFARTTRALGLTEAGRRLAARARAVLEAAESARRSLRARSGSGLAGTLRVTSVPSFGQSVLAPLLARFQALHPELRIELRLTHRRVDLVQEDIDVAFRLTRRPPQDCVAQPVMPFVVRAYAAPCPAWPLSHPQALQGLRCLIFGVPADGVPLHWLSERGQPAHTVTVAPAMLADDLGTLQAVAVAGGGVVLAPSFSVQAELARGALVDVLPGWQLQVQEGTTVQALTLALPQAPESARALVQFVRAALA